ncbi:MAG: type II toxin-antitoxin system VapC family toxin [Thermoprotei archaeon]
MTTDLAFYEIGNFLWKVKRQDLLEDFSKVLKFINVESVGLNEEVIRLAVEEKITYYDATYLFLSRKYNVPLASDDEDLVRKGAKRSSEII